MFNGWYSTSIKKLILWLLAIIILTPASLTAQADITEIFRHPTSDARPWTYWFWINGNITREGITADLEAMARVGIGGVLIMEVANPRNMAPPGPVKFASPEWKELFQHVLREAKRLGLQVNMNNDAGWCGSGGPWVAPEQSMKQIVSTAQYVTGPSHVDLVLATPETLEGFYRDIALFAIPEETTRAVAINGAADAGIIQLTDRMTSDGRMTWDAPPGNWKLLRVGYTSTGRKNKPAPKSGEGLECDKFDADALASHFNAFIGNLIERNKELAGKTFVSTHIDSWEVGPQNWTKDFATEFRKRRGYDVTPWLSVIADMDTETTGLVERFMRDFTLTCAELNDDNYARALRNLANANGLSLSIEAYGQSGFLNPLTYGAEADIPVSEFWISRWDAWHLLSPRLMASVSHVFGKPITAAESFTSFPDKDPFTEHPYSVKSIGDWAMCEGVNRFIFHRTVHDPWTTLVPGMSFAGFGWHVDRNQTWFEQSSPFMAYIARCQSILQRGEFVADVGRLVPDGETRGNTRGMHQIPDQYEPLPAGYNYDYISDKALLSELRTERGRLITRGGMEYSALQLPQYTTMTLEVARKLAELVADGATVVGPKPNQTPGLTDYPSCDSMLREIADKTWDPKTQRHVVSDKSIQAVLAEKGVAPDFLFVIDPPVTTNSITSITGRNKKRPRVPEPKEMPTSGLNYIHRRLPEGEFYFVANPQYRDVNAICTFRVSNMAPEIWYPETGEIRRPLAFQSGNSVQLPIHFEPAEALLIVFREKANPSAQIVEIQKDGKSLFGKNPSPASLPRIWLKNGKPELEATEPGKYEFQFSDGRSTQLEISDLPDSVQVSGPWTVKFQPNRGAPEEAEFQQLLDWSKHEQEGIRYFSGTATYSTNFEVDKEQLPETRWNLDLGKVLVIAEVSVNGKELGVFWKPPFKVDVTDVIQPGHNVLEVKVTNLWPNRMIGDEQYPDDSSKSGSWVKGRLDEWPDWIKNGTQRPETRRITFTTFKHYQKDSPLIPSGLLGPVKIEAVQNYQVNP